MCSEICVPSTALPLQNTTKDCGSYLIPRTTHWMLIQTEENIRTSPIQSVFVSYMYLCLIKYIFLM